jgi:hypothetical protein
VGGLFASIGGQMRNRIAAIDMGTLTPTAWNPDITGGSVINLLPDGGTIYACGGFTTVGIAPRNKVAAIDAASGAALAFSADANDYVTSMVLVGNTLYCGGNFTTSFMQPRNRTAAFDATTGSLLPFAPVLTSASVETMDLVSGFLYLGGYFFGINGVPGTAYFGGVTLAGANAPGFDPRAGGAVRAMLNIGSTLYLGGAFGHVTREPYANLAEISALSVVGVGPGATPALSAPRVYPNPFAGTTTVEVTLASPGETRVGVYDVAGRRVRTLHAGPLAPGARSFSWDGRDERRAPVPSGVYFVKVEHAGHTRTQKLVRVH